MGMDELIALAERASQITEPGTLRFSHCVGQGHGRYRWHGVRADDEQIVTFLCACWNNREDIAAALRARAEGRV